MILRIILGDQLNPNHSWFKEKNQENYLYAMMELRSETDYVMHHYKKVVAFFDAMRNFHHWLQTQKLNTVYYKLTDKENKQRFTENILFLIDKYNIEEVHYQFPDEKRLYDEFKELKKKSSIAVKAFDSEHFYCSLQELAEFGKEKKYELLENFYRHVRKKNHVLLENEKPLGGKWNYDAENRNKWKEEFKVPKVLTFDNSVDEIIADLEQAKIETFGQKIKLSQFPNSREQALVQFDYFLKHLLQHFGTYQDAMHTEEVMLFHSNLSFALNVKMISPKEIVEKTETYFYENQDAIELAQVEGFIRQIIGWREYVRMMYWNHFDSMKKGNFLDHNRKLPDVYWTGKSKMNCVANCAQNSLDNAYAHHIQRLMVLGNFALLMETQPDEVDVWYLGVYADAIEWVQLPNTRGMSQFADGGKIATKPYVSSGNYIDKMSNYCTDCSYDKKTKYEENSCPFNSLYWNFLDRNREKLEENRRMKMMYALLNKMDKTELSKTLKRANHLLETRNF